MKGACDELAVYRFRVGGVNLLPYLAEDENGLMFYFAQRGDNTYGIGLARRTDPNENVGPHCFSVDTVMDMIDRCMDCGLPDSSAI